MSNQPTPTTIKYLDGSEVEIAGEIPAEQFSKYRAEALKTLGEGLTLDGFRKGHIPDTILVREIGNENILNHMAERAIQDAYPIIIKEHNISPIGRPSVRITKQADGNPLGFVLTTALMPKVTLPDYKLLAQGKKREDAVPVSDEDVNKALLQLQKMRTSPPERDGEKDEEVALLPLDDDFARGLGPFSSLMELRDKIRENLETERARELRDKHRASIVEAIIRDTKADLPQVLVDSELAKMFAEMRSNISSMGIERQGYLDKAKKTEDDLRLEWRDKAKERVTANLAILEIGRDQGVEVTDEEIAPDLSTLLEQYPDADPDRARAYVNESLYNNKVLEYLEGQSDDDQKK